MAMHTDNIGGGAPTEVTYNNNNPPGPLSVPSVGYDLFVDPTTGETIQIFLPEPSGEPPSIAVMLEVFFDLAKKLRTSSLITHEVQLEIVESTGIQAAELAWKSGLTNGLMQIVGGSIGAAFTVKGISTLTPKGTKFSTKNGGKPASDQVQFPADTKPDGFKSAPHLTQLRNKKTGQESQLTLLSDGPPKEKTNRYYQLGRDVDHFEPKRNPKTKTVVEHTFTRDFKDLSFNSKPYKPTPVEGKVNQFTFVTGKKPNASEVTVSAGDGPRTLVINKETGNIEDIPTADLKDPKNNHMLPITADGNGNLLAGGQQIGHLKADGLNFNKIGETPVQNHSKLGFGTDSTKVEVEFVEFQPMKNGKPMPRYLSGNDKILFAKESGLNDPEHHVNNVPKNVAKHSKEAGVVSQVQDIEHHQSSQNWTSLGDALSRILTGAGSLWASSFDSKKIEVETEGQVANQNIGLNSEFRGSYTELLRQTQSLLTQFGDQIGSQTRI